MPNHSTQKDRGRPATTSKARRRHASSVEFVRPPSAPADRRGINGAARTLPFNGRPPTRIEPEPLRLSVSVALGHPVLGLPVRHGVPRSLRGRHLHRTTTGTVQWITSFSGLTVTEGPNPPDPGDQPEPSGSRAFRASDRMRDSRSRARLSTAKTPAPVPRGA